MKLFLPKTIVCFALLLLSGTLSVYAQTITGRVSDASAKPLQGVTVMFKGTASGTVTDARGNYTINNRTGAKILVFSCIGMKEEEIQIAGMSKIDVTMKEDVSFLDDVVVIGYAEQKRKDVMGSVVSVDSRSVLSVPSNNFTESLSGKMAGVRVVTVDGEPDSPVEIKVRGTGSITQDSSPLYIVDGFPVDNISDIAAQDIKSVDVLKDAFSTAIYGSRGAYGVVLITTKDAARGKISLEYDGYWGVKRMSNPDAVEVCGPYDFARYSYEMAVLSGSDLTYRANFGNFKDMELYADFKGNDWLHKLYGNTGVNYNHNIRLSGSVGKTRWNASYTHYGEDAIMMNSNFRRDNFNFRGTSSPVKSLTFSFSARYSNSVVKGTETSSVNDKGTATSGRLIHALRYSPVPLEYLENLDDEEALTNFGTNPVSDVNDNDRRTRRESWNVSGNVTWTIIPNLKLKIDGGMDNYSGNLYRFYGLTSYYTRSKATILNKPNTQETTENSRSYRNTNTLTYNFENILPKKHKLDLLLGQEYIFRQSSKDNVVAEGFPDFYDSDMARRYRGSAELISSSSKFYNENEVLLSFFCRGNYCFDDRYSLSAAFRADGSSKFAAGNRWGYFPSVAAAWNISNEPWMKQFRMIDQLKIRYSFGAAGNNRIPAGSVRRLFNANQTTWIDGASNIVVPNSTMPNPDLKWETTLSHNLGIDFTFFKRRFSGTLEAYNNVTRDLLIEFPVSGSGYNSQFRNLGSVLNRGVELSLNGILVEKRNVGLSVSGNIAYNFNKVLSLGGVKSIQATSGWQSVGTTWDYLVSEGDALGSVYGYLCDGWYLGEDFNWNGSRWVLKDGVVKAASTVVSSLMPGVPKYKDISGPDGVPDGEVDEYDKVKLGNVNPDLTGGFSISMNFYGFDLNAAFSFGIGGKVYNANKIELTTRGAYAHRNVLTMSAPGSAFTHIDWATGDRIVDPAVLDEVNKDAVMWNPYNTQYIMSDYFLEDRSFLRLNSLSLGYTVPQALTQKAKIQRLRFYVTGSNLFCLSHYSGFDPEVSTRRYTYMTPGVDSSAYPKTINVVLGASISF